jgi:hypothetical protein
VTDKTIQMFNQQGGGKGPAAAPKAPPAPAAPPKKK